jgi:ABC-2 type transport system permease protein
VVEGLLAGRDSLLIYRKLIGARIRSEWQYRAAFVMTTVMQLASAFLTFAGIAVLFHNVPRLAGWSLAEVGLLYGMAETSFNVADTFASQVERAEFHIRAGSFDSFLIRPLGPLLQLCAGEFAYRRLNKIVHAVVILAIAATRLAIPWDLVHGAVLLATIVTGAVIFGALWVIYCSVAFWTVSSSEFVYAAVTGGEVASQYPLDVFGGWLRRWFTAVMPIAFVAYYPARWLLGRGAPTAMLLAGPLVAITLSIAARLVWRAGIRHYRGTGS